MTNLTLRQSVTGEPRGPLCGMGICFECRDAHNQRTCQLPNAPATTVPFSRSTQPVPPATTVPFGRSTQPVPPATAVPFGRSTQPVPPATAVPFGRSTQPVPPATAVPFGRSTQPVPPATAVPFSRSTQPVPPATAVPFGRSTQPVPPATAVPFGRSTQPVPPATAVPFSRSTQPVPPATTLPNPDREGGASSGPTIVIVGAGPAGIAAALILRELNQPFIILDDNPTAGGQIWRGDQARTNLLGSSLRTTTRVISIDPKAHTLLLEDAEGSYQLPWTKLILATGSRELFLPFPGWTLPGVFGAGGLQALVKSGLNVQGKRIIVAGTGPLLLAVAALLRTKGADVRLIAEQAPLTSLTPFAAALLRRPAKLLQGAGLGWTLAGVPYRTSTWVTAAEGTTRLESVTLHHNGQIKTEPCDYAAIGYGLIPNLELQTLAGDSPDIITAQTGDVQLASLAGAAAACHAVGQPCNEAPLADARDFDAALARAFILRPELRNLAAPETFVCRCEDVSYSRLAEWTSFRAAKLQTRCGMGPCQGRVCGAAAQFLFGWTDTSVRPPAFPARISSLVTQEPVTKEGDL